MESDNYLLDFLVTKSTFDQDTQIPNDSIFLYFQADGTNEPIYTFKKEAQKVIEWKFPARMVLKIDNLQNACLYATVCSYSDSSKNSTPLGNAKIKLCSFPVGRPANISFPVFNPNNSALRVGTINLTATIAAMIRSNYSMAIPITR